jgi:AcrR family transcriptional regulator
MRSEGTRERLLDTAEKLMASTSTVAISLRDITSHANTTLAAVNYHLGSKESLVNAMVRRTAERLHTAWNESLGEIESESCDSPVSLAVILQAFRKPARDAADIEVRDSLKVLTRLQSEYKIAPEVVDALKAPAVDSAI